MLSAACHSKVIDADPTNAGAKQAPQFGMLSGLPAQQLPDPQSNRHQLNKRTMAMREIQELPGFVDPETHGVLMLMQDQCCLLDIAVTLDVSSNGLQQIHRIALLIGL